MFAAPIVAKERPALAVTMDDVRWQSIPEANRTSADEDIRSAIRPRRAALFVVGSLVDNEMGRGILENWSAAGHVLGNHTWSHRPLSGSTPEDFERDILRNEQFLRAYPTFTRLFRFPMLKEGGTAGVRDRERAFLHAHGYRNGAVTIDASDWYYDQRLRARLEAEPGFDAARFREPYLAHLWDRAQYYDGLSHAVLGRSARHTLLIHYNLLNALFLSDALNMFVGRGWDLIGADEAFRDPVFRREPRTVPAGESLLWALAKESGRFEGRLRYPGEDGDYEKEKLDRLGL